MTDFNEKCNSDDKRNINLVSASVVKDPKMSTRWSLQGVGLCETTTCPISHKVKL